MKSKRLETIRQILISLLTVRFRFMIETESIVIVMVTVIVIIINNIIVVVVIIVILVVGSRGDCKMVPTPQQPWGKKCMSTYQRLESVYLHSPTLQ